jgi:hypothetical protein
MTKLIFKKEGSSIRMRRLFVMSFFCAAYYAVIMQGALAQNAAAQPQAQQQQATQAQAPAAAPVPPAAQVQEGGAIQPLSEGSVSLVTAPTEIEQPPELPPPPKLIPSEFPPEKNAPPVQAVDIPSGATPSQQPVSAAQSPEVVQPPAVEAATTQTAPNAATQATPAAPSNVPATTKTTATPAKDNTATPAKESVTDAASAKDPAGVDKEKNTTQAKKIPSLLFTYWQHQSILDALKSRGTIIAKIPDEFMPDDAQAREKMEKPADREITLSGIAFVHENEWTVWLNGMRITPHAIPPEIIDLKVFKEHIDVKWYDKYSNKIFPIRIRPHQRFNLDTRVFLPG